MHQACLKNAVISCGSHAKTRIYPGFGLRVRCQPGRRYRFIAVKTKCGGMFRISSSTFTCANCLRSRGIRCVVH